MKMIRPTSGWGLVRASNDFVPLPMIENEEITKNGVYLLYFLISQCREKNFVSLAQHEIGRQTMLTSKVPVLLRKLDEYKFIKTFHNSGIAGSCGIHFPLYQLTLQRVEDGYEQKKTSLWKELSAYDCLPIPPELFKEKQELFWLFVEIQKRLNSSLCVDTSLGKLAELVYGKKEEAEKMRIRRGLDRLYDIGMIYFAALPREKPTFTRITLGEKFTPVYQLSYEVIA